MYIPIFIGSIPQENPAYSKTNNIPTSTFIGRVKGQYHSRTEKYDKIKKISFKIYT